MACHAKIRYRHIWLFCVPATWYSSACIEDDLAGESWYTGKVCLYRVRLYRIFTVQVYCTSYATCRSESQSESQLLTRRISRGDTTFTHPWAALTTTTEETKAVGSAVIADGARDETAILPGFFLLYIAVYPCTWHRRMMRSRSYNKMPHSAKDLTTD